MSAKWRCCSPLCLQRAPKRIQETMLPVAPSKKQVCMPWLEVPEMLSQLKHIKTLELVFTGKVVLPEWMDKLTIDNFTIRGEMTEAEKIAIEKRFPNVILREK